MRMAAFRTTLMILALHVVACDEPEAEQKSYVFTDAKVDGDLTYTSSRSKVANPTTMLAGSFSPFRCSTTGPCKQSTVAYYRLEVRFDPPTSPGVYALEDLAGVVCEAETLDDTERCSAISGSLEVTKLTPPCEGNACGQFEGVLTIDPPKNGSRAVIEGSVNLHYSEQIYTIDSSGRSSGCNFQGG